MWVVKVFKILQRTYLGSVQKLEYVPIYNPSSSYSISSSILAAVSTVADPDEAIAQRATDGKMVSSTSDRLKPLDLGNGSSVWLAL